MSSTTPPVSEMQRTFAEFLASAPATPPPTALLGSLAHAVQPATARLGIYKNNVFVRLVDALAANYPAVARLVGDEFFRFAALEYLAERPTRERTLLHFGADFAQFLEGFEPAASVPYLPDVARLEHFYLLAYHAAEAEPIDERTFCALVGDSESDPQVALHPSASLFSSAYPVSRIWELNVNGANLEQEVNIPGGREFLLVIRPRATVEVRRVSKGAFAALVAILAGRSYEHALDAGSCYAPRGNVHRHLRALADGESFCHPAPQKTR